AADANDGVSEIGGGMQRGDLMLPIGRGPAGCGHRSRSFQCCSVPSEKGWASFVSLSESRKQARPGKFFIQETGVEVAHAFACDGHVKFFYPEQGAAGKVVARFAIRHALDCSY